MNPQPFFCAQGVSPTIASPFQEDGLSLTVEAGEIVAIMGVSGCGKSRFLRALADLDPNQGTVSLCGQDRSTFKAPIWRRHAVYLAAEAAWWADTIGEHFQDPQRALTLLPELGMPPQALEWEVARTSTGERQRLAFLRALTLPMALSQPRILLLDEPTAALDPQATLAVEQILRSSCSPQRAVLMITHHKDQAIRLANRLLVIKDGALHEEPLQ